MLCARLISGTKNVQSRPIIFALQGIPVGSSRTDFFGRADLVVPALPPWAAGTYADGVGAGFIGDGAYGPSTGAAPLIIQRLPTWIEAGGSGTYLGSATVGGALKFWPPESLILQPLSDRRVDVFVQGRFVGSTVTGQNGAGAVDFSLAGLNSGTYVVDAVFWGDINLEPVSDRGELVVLPQTTSLLVAPAAGPANGTTTLSALLRFNGGLPLADRSLVFYLNDPIVGTAVTAGNGIAMLEGVSLEGISPGEHGGGVKALFLGELNFRPTAGDATLTVGPTLASTAPN
ncbi:MAG: hypothetical protein M3Q31_02485 [Actinomycetota bacterium]|nr:hypothetical protein [Actinomycetota bacterium]